MNDTEKLMKKCQTGDGRWPDAANNLLAECYEHIGKLIAENERMREALGEIARGPASGAPHFSQEIASESLQEKRDE